MTTLTEPHGSIEHPGFVTLEQLRAQSGLKRKALEARLLREGISTFSLPEDRRRRMIRTEDALRLTQPREVTRRTSRAAHTGR